jgi:hypothetical protein
MRRLGRAVLATILVTSLSGVVSVPGTAGAADIPLHSVTIDGAGAVTYPAFDRDVDRYAVRPKVGGPASVTVRASTSDPSGVVRVDGRLVTGGFATVDGLRAGDEISVLVTDSAGTAAYSFIMVPSEFPLLRRTTPSDPRSTAGEVLLTLGKWISAGPFFETAVDANGVPVYVRQSFNSMDLHQQPNGHYSVARGGDNGADVVELDEQFREVRRWRTKGLVHTDGHDAILNADGSAYLMAYEPNEATDMVDAVIQHVSASGDVLFQWNTADHVDIAAETVDAGNRDYAHINSFEVMADGDLLVSFRHLSSVFKIARTDHDGFAAGDVVWRLGGRASDFTFLDTEGNADGGPCAQHTATQLANGDIMVFDNGAWNVEPLCIDPDNPSGAPVPRVPTRIARWSLDETTMTATMVKDFQVRGRYAIFAGSAQPLAGGNTVVGWASATQAVASELSPTGEVLWDLEAPEDPKYFTYRAFKTEVPDAIVPEVAFPSGTDRTLVAVGDSEVPDLTCTDRGGSNLRSCLASGFDTTTPGSRTMTVVATDGAGNTTTVPRASPVVGTAPAPSPTTATATPTPTPAPPVAQHRPDLRVKVLGGTWRGRDAYDTRRGQTARDATAGGRSVFRIRLQNDGDVTERFHVRLRSRAKVGAPRWLTERRRSARLAPGESVTFSLVLRRGGSDLATTRVIARSGTVRSARDRVWTRTTWR